MSPVGNTASHEAPESEADNSRPSESGKGVKGEESVEIISQRLGDAAPWLTGDGEREKEERARK